MMRAGTPRRRPRPPRVARLRPENEGMLRLTCATALLAVYASPALAAESYDNCTGYIESLPASISTQGTWCLRKDLATGMASGNAIEVKANNVVIDCNDFKIGGLAAGASTLATGIASGAGRQNIIVRNCTVRGFQFGTWLLGDNHVVEHSRFDVNTVVGIRTDGDGNEIRDNVVTSTGGRPAFGVAMAVIAQGTGGRVLDNRIHGVSAELDGSNQLSAGLYVEDGVARGNSISGLLPTGTPHGIRLYHSVARDNIVMQAGPSTGYGIICLIDDSGQPTGFSHHNTIRHFAAPHTNCNEADNAVEP
jgi:hypothetical protein